MINTIEVIGNIGKMEDLECTKTGISMLKFSVCENVRFKKGENEWETLPQWHYIVAWRDLAENAENVLKPGMLVFIRGNQRLSTYEDKNGVTRETRTIYPEIIAPVIPAWKKKDKQATSFDDMGQEFTEDIPF